MGDFEGSCHSVLNLKVSVYNLRGPRHPRWLAAVVGCLQLLC